MEVFRKAQEMASHTALILANDRIFNPKVDPKIIELIKESAYGINAKAWAANKIRAETNTFNRAIRYSLQEEAITMCDELLAYIGIAKKLFHVRSRKVKYWAKLVVDTRNLLQAWKESDVRRYGQP